MKKLLRINPISNYFKRFALAGSTARIVGSLAALALANTAAHAAPTVWNVNIGTEITTGDNFVGAAAENTANSVWNSLGNTNLLPLVDSTGAAGTVTVQLGNTAGFGGNGGYLPEIFTTWCKHAANSLPVAVTYGGLSPTGTYDLIVYADWYWQGGSGVPITQTTGIGMSGTVTLNNFADGVGTVHVLTQDTDPTDNGSVKGNWIRIAGLTPSASGILAFNMNGRNAPLSGFQLVQTSAGAADTTPPTLVSFEHNKGAGPILVNEPVTYTVTFSEAMTASTVNTDDFGNTGTAAINIDSVTPTADPAVFLVGVTSSAAGTLQLQINAGATLTDLVPLSLVTTSAIPDDSSIVVQDLPKTPTTITVVSSDSATTYGQNVTFTATVSPIPSGGTVQFSYDANYLGTPVAVNTITGEATVSTTTLGAATHAITAQYSGNFAFEASTTAAPDLSQEVSQAPLTVRAQNTLRAPNTANPDPFPYQITGYQNGESFATSGVTGTPLLSTDAVLESPVGTYTITCALGILAASNYSFTLENGTLTVEELTNTFSVNFYVGPDWPYGGLTTDEQKANLLLSPSLPAGLGDWFTPGWSNFLVPWNPGAPLAPVTLTSNKGSSATFTFKDCRGGWTFSGPRTTLLGDGNGNMMDGHVNSTLDGNYLFDMEVTGIPFAVYDVIFYIGANQDQFGDGTGVIVFNGGAERAFKLKPGAFDGTFTEMVDATTEGNYIVFTGVTGSSFTTQTWGTGPNGFNHVGPNGFQIREAAAVTSGFTTWAAANAGGQSAGEDFDNDGVDNAIEYFMGQTGSSFTAMPGLDGTNTVTWPMSPTYAGTYEVQTSPDLVTWTNVSGPKPTPVGGFLTYTLAPGAPGGKSFVRLLVTPTP